MPRLTVLLPALLLVALAGCTPSEQPGQVPVSPEARRTEREPGDAVTPDPAALALSREGLGAVRFGDEADGALARLRAVLGRPNTVTKWLPKQRSLWGRCPGEQLRGAKWGDLWVLFADSTELADRPHVFAWLTGQAGADELGLRTSEGIGVGSRLADVKAAYGERVTVEPYELGARVTIAPAPGEDAGARILSGTAAGADDPDTIRALRGGLPCEA